MDWLITILLSFLASILVFYFNLLFERRKLQEAQIKQKVSVTISDTQNHVWIPFTQLPDLFNENNSFDQKGRTTSSATLEPALHSLVTGKNEDFEENYLGKNKLGEEEKEEESQKLGTVTFLKQSIDDGNCFLCQEPLSFVIATCGDLQDQMGSETEGHEDCSMCCWCQRRLHNRCIKKLSSQECDYGLYRKYILPPTHLNPSKVYGGVPGWLNKRRSIKWLRRPLDKDSEPLLVFINPRSGQLEGASMLLSLRQLLNPIQVLDLSKTPPNSLLQICKEIPTCRILVCGGDGTVGWILNEIEKINSSLPKNSSQIAPPIAVLPTGTSNDLSRVLGWGGFPQTTSASEWIEDVIQSNNTTLDRWKISFVNSEAKYFGRRKKHVMMTNYFSIGVDAAIALKFHNKRNKYPDLFRNRWLNRYVWYGFYGARDIFQASCEDLQNEISLTMDGKSYDGKLPKIEGIVVLNIQRYGGGTDVWGKDEERPSSLNDQKFEVFCFYSSLHLGQVVTGVDEKVLKLGQAKTLTITYKKRSIPVQIDGEPWNQPPCTITLTHHNQVPMLVKKIKSN